MNGRIDYVRAALPGLDWYARGKSCDGYRDGYYVWVGTWRACIERHGKTLVDVTSGVSMPRLLELLRARSEELFCLFGSTLPEFLRPIDVPQPRPTEPERWSPRDGCPVELLDDHQRVRRLV